ncbi:MAG TPA: alkaline phosphatase family protein, partial [Candidatus Dormibacteraeota bacterium]|nr:alkaline phosphatase family protein [Candidatus Dormibacteraeota bacterium]
TEAYDQIKVDAILNEIDGWTSGHTSRPGTPAIFGMNFQAVSVGQKLIDPWLSCVRSGNAPGCDPSYVPGGYEPGTLAFTPQLRGAIRFVDRSLATMVRELKRTGQLARTDIIVTAKHGQSPIDPSKLAKIGHKEGSVVTSAGVDIAQLTDDDIALMWLSDQAQTATAVAALMADKAGANTARTDYVLSGQALIDKFGDPSVDPRTPDLIVQPIVGTIYSKSGAKVAEHGGFALDDTNVALIVTRGWQLQRTWHGRSLGNRWLGGRIVSEPVATTQVAPTILELLGLDPSALDAVRMEGTQVLPSAG